MTSTMTNISAGRTHQYLRSEYIQPPPGPPSLDAKKSPLALLAQTCSAIGKDNSKSRISSLINNKQSTESPSSPFRNPSVNLNSKTSSPGSEHEHPEDVTKRNSKHSKNQYHGRKSLSSTGQAARKLSEPAFPQSKTENLQPPRRPSPIVLQSTDRSSRILSSTPIGISDESSTDCPSDNKLSSGNCSRSSDKKYAHPEARHSPLKQKQRQSPLTPDPSICNEKLQRKDGRRHSDVYPPSGIKSDFQLNRHPSHKHDTQYCNLPSHPSMCGCAYSNSKLLRKDFPFPPGNAVNAVSPMSGMTTPCDWLCTGCQIPHLPGTCDLSALKQTEAYQHLHSLESLALVGLPSSLPASYNALQSQFMWAALAGRNEYLSANDAHVCKWVTATEGNCGKRFNTREQLLEHLSTHALPASSSIDMNGPYSNFLNTALGRNHIPTYFSNPTFGIAASNPPNVSNHLASVALANERFLQSSQQKCNPLNRYHPYKTYNKSVTNPIISLLPSNSATIGLYGSPYSFYG